MGRRRRRSSESDWTFLPLQGMNTGVARFPFQGKALYSCAIAIFIFLAFQCFLLWHQTSVLEDEKLNLENDLHVRQRSLDDAERKIRDRDRDMFRMETRLRDLEQRVKSQHARRGGKDLRTIYFITPSQRRPEQRADLTRLSHTLMHVANLFWLVVEDAETPSPQVEQILTRSGLKYAHLSALTPAEYRLNSSDPFWKAPRGVAQRNAALRYLRTNMMGEKLGFFCRNFIRLLCICGRRFISVSSAAIFREALILTTKITSTSQVKITA